MRANINEAEEISETRISERGNTPNQVLPDTIHVSKTTNPPPEVDYDLLREAPEEAYREIQKLEDAHQSQAMHPPSTSDNSPESLIQEECFQSTGQPYYRCKIHPDIWDIDLEQMKGHCKNEHTD